MILNLDHAIYLYACNDGVKHGVAIATFISQSKQYNRERVCLLCIAVHCM